MLRSTLWIPEVGMSIKTPFGVARILHVDLAAGDIDTDHGRWGGADVFMVDVPDGDASAEEWEIYLSEPAVELRGAVDIQNVKCACGCSYNCSMRTHTAKNTGVIERSYHESPSACSCFSMRCACAAQ